MKSTQTLLKLFFLCTILFLTTQNCNADSYKSDTYKAFIAGNMKSWKNLMTDFSKQPQLTNTQKLELARYYYGYIGYTLGIKNKDEAQIYIVKGDELLDDLIKNNPTADAYALKGAFYGFKIGVTPMKAPFIGKSSAQNVDKALSLSANNIQANIEKGNILYYSPSAFGGDKTEAKKYYNKAIQLFENTSGLTKENWLYLSLLTKVAQINADEKNYQEAKKIYEKILEIEPEYNYVKNELYPELKKKL